jgi:hypothetical protein
MLLLRIFIFAGFLLLLTAYSQTVEGMEAGLPLGDISKLDPVSAGCITCHDGSNGPHVSFCLLEQRGLGCGGHIVSVSYVDLAARSEKLREVSSLPPQLLLHDGKITCVTCHGPEPHDGMPLAIDNIDSALCRACHVK